MIRPGTNEGVLNDWDLAVRPSRSHTRNTERTGTLPFMALDLMDALLRKESISRVYRHDFEAFSWILPWVFIRFTNGEDTQDAILDRWTTGDLQECRT